MSGVLIPPAAAYKGLPQLLLWNEKNEDIPRIPAYGQKNNRDQMEKALCQAGGGIFEQLGVSGIHYRIRLAQMLVVRH